MTSRRLNYGPAQIRGNPWHGLPHVLLIAVGLVGSWPQWQSPVWGKAPAAEEAAAETSKLDDASQELSEVPIAESDREHWSFQPLQIPGLPELVWSEDAVAPRGPVDAFILERLQKLELGLAPKAQPHHLLRRLAFDLTGLPPSPEMRESFHENYASAPDAYERDAEGRLRRQCRDCRSAYKAARLRDRYATDPEYRQRVSDRNRAYRDECREYLIAYSRTYYAENRERLIEDARNYRRRKSAESSR